MNHHERSSGAELLVEDELDDMVRIYILETIQRQRRKELVRALNEELHIPSSDHE